MELRAGKIAGMEVRFGPPAAIGFAFLWPILGWLSTLVLPGPALRAVALGLVGAVAHILVGVFHHLSHALAARRTGYPMEAVRMGRLLILGESIYPADEPALPGRIHIRRALGGPVGSFLLGLAAGAAALLLRPSAGPAYWLALFVSLDSLLIFTVGVLIPLGFTDMSTILRWWGK